MKNLTHTEIQIELKNVQIQIDKLNFDNNGNPVDFEFASSLFEQEEKLFDILNSQEIKVNIARLEHTIAMNCWNKGYVVNCKEEIESYKSKLKLCK